MVVRATGFWPVVRPGQLGSATAHMPLAPLPLPMRPPPLVSSPHSILPRSNSLYLSSLSPRGALGFGDDDRRIWTPR
jgi:hypothetical protein